MLGVWMYYAIGYIWASGFWMVLWDLKNCMTWYKRQRLNWRRKLVLLTVVLPRWYAALSAGSLLPVMCRNSVPLLLRKLMNGWPLTTIQNPKVGTISLLFWCVCVCYSFFLKKITFDSFNLFVTAFKKKSKTCFKCKAVFSCFSRKS